MLSGSVAALKRMTSDAELLVARSGRRVDAALAEDGEAPERVIAQEYEPLLEGDATASQLDADEHEAGTRGADGGGDGDDDGEHGGARPLPPRARVLELACTYAAFFCLGSTILLPWNAIIVAQSYFGARLVGSPFEYSFASFVTLDFTLCNLLFLAHANATQQTARPLPRIFGSIAAIGLVLLAFCVSTRVAAIDASLFFGLLLALTCLAAAGASYLQNSVVALAALFGPSYLQGILSGQGAIGFGVSIVQLLSAVGSAGGAAKEKATAAAAAAAVVSASAATGGNGGGGDGGIGDYVDSLRRSAFAFFLVSTLLAVFAFGCHALLVRLPFYRLTVETAESEKKRGADKAEDDEDGDAEDDDKPSGVSLRAVERKIRVLGFAVFYVFLVTLAVFPAITASILSLDPPDDPDRLGFRSPTIFVPLHFVVFNAGDWLGRALPQLRALRFKSTRALVLASLARTLFIPLFLFCNVTGGVDERPPIIQSDALYFLILLLFSVTNGYVSTLVMIAGVELPTLTKGEVDVAATALAFYLTTGLAAGSLASFGVRAAVCQCNPFLS